MARPFVPLFVRIAIADSVEMEPVSGRGFLPSRSLLRSVLSRFSGDPALKYPTIIHGTIAAIVLAVMTSAHAADPELKPYTQ